MGEPMVFEHGPHSDRQSAGGGTGWPVPDCPASRLCGRHSHGDQHLVGPGFFMGADSCGHRRNSAYHPYLFGRHHLTKRITGLC